MRSNGVLMPLSSLPAPHGIGDFGTEAFVFVDYLGLLLNYNDTRN